MKKADWTAGGSLVRKVRLISMLCPNQLGSEMIYLTRQAWPDSCEKMRTKLDTAIAHTYAKRAFWNVVKYSHGSDS